MTTSKLANPVVSVQGASLPHADCPLHPLTSANWPPSVAFGSGRVRYGPESPITCKQLNFLLLGITITSVFQLPYEMILYVLSRNSMQHITNSLSIHYMCPNMPQNTQHLEKQEKKMLFITWEQQKYTRPVTGQKAWSKMVLIFLSFQ